MRTFFILLAMLGSALLTGCASSSTGLNFDKLGIPQPGPVRSPADIYTNDVMPALQALFAAEEAATYGDLQSAANLADTSRAHARRGVYAWDRSYRSYENSYAGTVDMLFVAAALGDTLDRRRRLANRLKRHDDGPFNWSYGSRTDPTFRSALQEARQRWRYERENLGWNHNLRFNFSRPSFGAYR